MLKYGKEIAIGFLPVLLVFLVFLKVNIVPLLLVAALGGILFYAVRARGNVAPAGGKRRLPARSSVQLTFDEIGGQERAKQELTEALDFW
ncbi:hypothetical protein PACILC2_23680 [Paenibacillus cisolokensis]|uniref:Uncharacterized protein n=1 Tax=Paenibacillus cisolokensis TaxID=1658519 RepID=A0ABQ4N6K5_9BACL|nr:hypothetical protein PACILC2_23680 [Paenibacillus cisolokensis]